MKEKFRILKLLLIVFAWLLIILTVTFLIYSYTRLNDKQIPEEYFYNKRYVTEDRSVSLTFGGSLDYVSLSSNTNILTCKYKENILTLTDGNHTYAFIVIDKSTMFGDDIGYMYLIGELK